MNELFPVGAGLMVAFLLRDITIKARRRLLLVELSALLGLLASMISGELLISWVFAAFDIFLVIAVASVSMRLTFRPGKQAICQLVRRRPIHRTAPREEAS